ncbi:hypothetical protein I6J18_08875 [Peribacillus psychrosaccharolyticus]|uniref:Uncharacterized protein n=1 Tax=Peribacillus psychrosaccharolyticus TaxID=1407 RepID=A0A974NQF4_PERPY|nr:hypothetical protein [Peribacillus psychrosaccharolyticus]MEC2057701.1 hypothetical protein [Peribacillus psychrosaccharolyticus]MED3746391.1 hypothetical protein [Peribacillus psychrosaccharolyticus]QQT01934.1 hypothetical protein I6J18_08875 [Peribacillus psychrosaccharolyticus]
MEMQERHKLIANDFVTRGIIKNSEAATALLKSGIFIPKVPVLTHLQMSDAMISLRNNMNLLKDSRVPYMSLYKNILDSIGDRNLESIEALAMDENASLADIDDNENLENIEAVRPYIYDAAIKLKYI